MARPDGSATNAAVAASHGGGSQDSIPSSRWLRPEAMASRMTSANTVQNGLKPGAAA